jgi:hypothetical protein
MTFLAQKFMQRPFNSRGARSHAVRVLALAFSALECSALALLSACAPRPATTAAQDTEAAAARVIFYRPSQRAAMAAAQQGTTAQTKTTRGQAGNAAIFGDAMFSGSAPQATLATNARTSSTSNPTSDGNTPTDNAPLDSTWLVALLTISSDTPNAQEVAAIAANEARTRGGLPQVRVLERDGAWIVASAEFPRSAEGQARAELARVRELRSGDTQPFAAATLLAPSKRGETGSMPQFDLTALSTSLPPDVLYTLQVGIYQVGDATATPSDAELRDIRKAAEEAVRVLRADGAEAFYWHGPTRSTVTVGLFGERDVQRLVREGGKEITVAQRSERLAAAQAAFPQNLVNGMAIRVRVQGADTPDKAPSGRAGGFQPSFLIRLPER